ncbi:hypothetical protein F2Q69_00035892 [Brassica cretica]|uniref:Small ribosomal subunit protein uS17 N-terminal domain-containing protein n=1 Tax=Brassica cretica TaxID=69181 RepID=A0A8S9SII2_BRACR|nr:hypothetical protein F2Q69_00035892 [Brassica cretica]
MRAASIGSRAALMRTRDVAVGSRAVLDVDTSWNGVANGLGFVGFGLGFQSKSARTVSVREGASVLLAVTASPIVSYILASSESHAHSIAHLQTEKAFLKQPKVFLSSKISGKGKRPGKGGNRFSKNIGLGFKTPREAIQGTYIDRKCPFTGTVSIRGRILAGTCHSAKMQRTIIVRRNYLHFVKKYQRYEKRHSNIPAHVSPCFRVKEGDHVIIGQCRPLSKTVRFNVLKVIPAGASAFAKKAFTGM